jgi:ParB-like chromosome segregation protein Spo0J
MATATSSEPSFMNDGVPAPLRTRLLRGPVRTLPLASLVVSSSPRLAGMNEEHVQTLATAGGPLPPILVEQRSMRVIDGAHRVRAAALRGQQTIEARLIDGSEGELFVLAVQANSSHGLPLSLVDRKAAAQRIIGHFPHWSDRAVARAAGISDKTVSAIRRGVIPGAAQVVARVGCDGRLRPVDWEAGRRRATEVILANPHASLREIARKSGISPETARKVREQVRSDGLVPLPPGETDEHATRLEDENLASMIKRLRRDPMLRFTESGRFLLRLLDIQLLSPRNRNRLVHSVPPHVIGLVTDIAKACVCSWQELATQLETRHHGLEMTVQVRGSALGHRAHR